MIRGQERKDWSKLILESAGIEHLDKDAINIAREKYKEKMGRPHISEEVDAMPDEDFLNKIKLMKGHKVTNAAMVLLGKEEYDSFFSMAPSMMWRLYDSNGMVKDYEIFTIPFISVAEKLFARVRDLTYRYMPDQRSLFPKETQQYDGWLLRELLNNCIAHANYQLGGRIYVNEFEDSIMFTNPGSFLPESVETVLRSGYNPPFYRNQLLADSMVKFHMIDTATSGIKKVFRIQKGKYFPMPDYDFSTANQVSVTVYGKILNEKYTYILHDHPELDLEDVYLLDQVQKGKTISPEALKHLRKYHLVEGRVGNLYLSADVAQNVDKEAEYIRNRAFDDKYYKDMIMSYIDLYGSARRKDIRSLLWTKLPDILNDEKKENKIRSLLRTLKNEGEIHLDSTNRQTGAWIRSNKL